MDADVSPQDVLAFWRNAVEVRRLYAGQGRDLSCHVCRAVSLSVLLLLFLGLCGHNLYRYNWMWLAVFQAVAVHCARLKVAEAEQAAWAAPALRWAV